MLGLDFCDFANFLFLDVSLRCHEALSNLFPHLHELNLAAAALTHLKISKEHLYFCLYLVLSCILGACVVFMMK